MRPVAGKTNCRRYKSKHLGQSAHKVQAKHLSYALGYSLGLGEKNTDLYGKRMYLFHSYSLQIDPESSMSYPSQKASFLAMLPKKYLQMQIHQRAILDPHKLTLNATEWGVMQDTSTEHQAQPLSIVHPQPLLTREDPKQLVGNFRSGFCLGGHMWVTVLHFL